MLKLLFFAILLFVSACNPRLWCERNFPPTPITQIETVIRDTTLYLPGATVYDTLSLTDTLIRTHTIVDSAGRAQLVWWKDALRAPVSPLFACARYALYPDGQNRKGKTNSRGNASAKSDVTDFSKRVGDRLSSGRLRFVVRKAVWQAALARSRFF
jgi:hypothetical protein